MLDSKSNRRKLDCDIMSVVKLRINSRHIQTLAPIIIIMNIIIELVLLKQMKTYKLPNIFI